MDWSYARSWMLSLEVAGVATALNVAVALPLGYVLARKRFLGRWVVESVVMLPLVLPPTVVGFCLMFVIGRQGLWGWMTHTSLLFTLKAAILASAIVSFPLMLLPVRAGFAGILREYDEEARMAGLAWWQRFWFIALPLARGGILTGVLLSFARAMGEFGATLMLVGMGPRTRTLPIQIYYDAGSTDNFAAAWPAVAGLALTSVLVILLANRLRWLEVER